MSHQNINIIPYTEARHDEVIRMEKDIVQGSFIQLEMLKDHFLDRAKVFENYYSNLAITDDYRIVGNAIGAKTVLKVNDLVFHAGFGFDAKVVPGMRKNGIAKMLAKDLYKIFFQPQGLNKCFMTAKLNNAPILRVVSRALGKVWLYPFAYLTIPTGRKVTKQFVNKNGLQKFCVTLVDSNSFSKEYYISHSCGLSVFHTWKMYRLKIKKINQVYKTGMSLLKKFNTSLYSDLPYENDIVSFATLFDHNYNNIDKINLVLDDLRKDGIKYLIVCCQKNDSIYKYLKSSSINIYNYYLVSDFDLKSDDAVTIDVRCL